MGKLVRIEDGKVFDCFVLNIESNEYANNIRVLLYEDGKWHTSPIRSFRPAVAGKDY